MHEVVTKFGSVFRTDPGGNKRKDYFAATFEKVKEVEPENRELMKNMVVEIYEKTTGNKAFAANWRKPDGDADLDNGVSVGEEYPVDNINPDDIPF
jgi:hypothetical protein